MPILILTVHIRHKEVTRHRLQLLHRACQKGIRHIRQATHHYRKLGFLVTGDTVELCESIEVHFVDPVYGSIFEGNRDVG